MIVTLWQTALVLPCSPGCGANTSKTPLKVGQAHRPTNAHLLREVRTEDVVAGPQQITRRAVPWKRLPQLLRRPFLRRMSRHGEMQNPRAVVSQNQKYVGIWNRRVGNVKKSIETRVFR